MDTPQTRAELINLISRERESWDALLVQVGEDRMNLPGVEGNWTFKDVAGHLTTWRQRVIVRLRAAKKGETPPPPPWAGAVTAGGDFEPINRWIYMANRERPLADVLRDSRESLRQLEDAVGTLKEDELMNSQQFSWMGGTSLASSVMGNSCEHFFNDHEPAIQAWLSSLPTNSAPT